MVSDLDMLKRRSCHIQALAVESGARTPRRMHRGGIQSLLVLGRDAEVNYSLDIKMNTPFVRVLTQARIGAGCRSAGVSNAPATSFPGPLPYF